MSLVALGGMPIIQIGAANRQGATSLAALSNTTLDAVNEAIMMAGYVWWTDGGTHTVDTTGSSSIQWRSGTSTFANAGTTVKVGIAAIDTANGPPLRASNASDVISFDVSASFVGGGGGITSAAWQTSVPTSGSKSIVTGDLVVVAVQMTARGGADSVLIGTAAGSVSTPICGVTSFTGGAYANANTVPNVKLVASDGTLGFLYGGYLATVGTTTQTWNNGSATKEYGNVMRFPVPVTAYGAYGSLNFTGDCDLVLYSDPFGTPTAQRTTSIDLNTVTSATSTSHNMILFSSPYNLRPNIDYAIIAKPSSATNVAMLYKTFNAAGDQVCEPLGTSCYAINRDSGAFAAQNSNKDRFAIGLLVGAFSQENNQLINSASLVG